MAEKIKRLSALAVAKLAEPGYYCDGGGLWLQIAKSGSKSWVFFYSVHGKRREMGLGGLTAVGLAGARELAVECRTQLQAGRDPIVVRDAHLDVRHAAQARQMTFDQCAAAYVDAHRGSWKSVKHAKQWISTLATYASPVIGSLPVALVDTEAVTKILAPIWSTKTETATRLRGRIESILGWATVSKFRSGDNPAKWDGHLENLLASPSKIAPVKNHPALPWIELPAFMAALRKREGVAARAVEFAILTACRSGEVRGATWGELDLDGGKLWTIAADRMKASKEHRVPLADPAIALLGHRQSGERIVFPGQKEGTALSDMSLTAVLRRMGRSDITVHGFRSTFRDWCAEAVGNTFSREVCEHALAHSLPDKVEAAYRRGDLLGKRILLMKAWAEYCQG